MNDDLRPCCFPECGKWLAQRLTTMPAHKPAPAGLYDVAVWRSSRELPILVDRVSAPSPFQAIEQVMRSRSMRVCDHASAQPSGGQYHQIYRAFGVVLSKQSSAPLSLNDFPICDSASVTF